MNDKNENNETKLIQEQEMLLISKEALYVLCHVYQEIGKFVETQHCLDKIEKYIEDQKQRDEEQYVKITRIIGKAESNRSGSPTSSFAVHKSDLAMVRKFTGLLK